MEALLEKVKVSVKNGKPCEKILNIEVAKEAIAKEYDAFYQAVAPSAKIPGFRPGKAPRQVLENHYSGEAKERVLKNLISDSFRDALKETGLDPIVYPTFQDIDFKDSKLTFKASVEIRPKIKLSRVKGLAAKKEDAAVLDSEVDAELKRIQESMAQFKTIENAAAEKGNVVVADYTCVIEGKEVDKRTEDWLEIKEDAFLKEFTNQLIGLKPQDEKTIEVVLPETVGNKDWAGKKAVFQVRVKEIKSKTIPELNDDLAKEAGQFASFEELKNKIKTDLLAHKTREKDVAFENELLKELIKHNKIDLPEGLVQRRVEYLFDDARQGFVNQGGREEDFEKEKDKLMKGFETQAREQVHLAFLLDEIAEQEKISVVDSDLKAKYEQMAARVRQTVDKVEKYYSENENANQSLREQVRNEKAIQFIKQNAKPKR